MIILRKKNHFKNAYSIEEAQELVNDGYQVISNKLGRQKLVPQKKSEPKEKKVMKKK